MKALALLKATYFQWSRNKGPRLGAALAYYAIFSIPPLMMIALGAFSLIYTNDIGTRLQRQLAGMVGEQTSTTLLQNIQLTGQKRGIIASVIGVGVLFFGASGVFAELQSALNTIWAVKPKDSGLKGLIRGRFTSFTMVLGICFLLLVSLIISAVVAAMSGVLSSQIPGGATLGRLLEIGSSVIVVTFLFAMIFKLLPDVEIQWRDVWIGAFATSVLFSLGKFAIGEYIGQAGVGTGYGAAGSTIVLITWIYYSAQILLFGAQFTQVYSEHHGSRLIPKPNAELVERDKGEGKSLKTA